MSLIFPLCFFCLFFTRSSDTIEQNETYIFFFPYFWCGRKYFAGCDCSMGMFGSGQPGRCRWSGGCLQQPVPVAAGGGSHPALSEWVHQHHLDANVLYAAVLY